MGYADCAPPGAQGRARPASSPWSTVFTADQCPSPSVSDLCPESQLPSASPSSLCSPGGSAAAGPGPRRKGSDIRGRGLVRGAGHLREELWEPVLPQLSGREWAGGGGAVPGWAPGTGCCRPRGPPGSSDDDAATLRHPLPSSWCVFMSFTPFPAPSAPSPGLPQLLRWLAMGSGS